MKFIKSKPFLLITFSFLSLTLLDGCSILNVHPPSEGHNKSNTLTFKPNTPSTIYNPMSELLTLEEKNLQQNPTTPQPNNTGLFDWPLDDARLIRGYIPFKTGKRKKPHWGLDLAAPLGTPILAAHDGMVIYRGKGFHGYGNMILIEGNSGNPEQWATLYGHLSKYTVPLGSKVKKGQIIGMIGRTGRASGVHLHFEIRKAKGPVDPLLYLPQTKALAKVW